MEIINIENVEYVLGEYLISNAPIFSRSCRSSRDVVKKKAIHVNNYIFAKKEMKTGNWIKSDGKSIKFDKVLITKKYINENVAEINKDSDKLIKDEKGIEKAPEIIYLEDNEKFRDDEGNVLDIETRGVRDCDNVYFKVKDVSKYFGAERLHDHLLDKKGAYEEKRDYLFFLLNIQSMGGRQTNKQTNKKKELFLTYNGLIRVLMVSRNDTTKKFSPWAIKTLFTAQMGSIEQKEELAASVLGTNAKVVRKVFSKDTNTIPCVYFFILGRVKNLRKSMNIDLKYSDDYLVCKYGQTKDLARRTSEHISFFNKIEGCDLTLKYYSYIDPQYTYTAENDIKESIIALESDFKYENMNELVIIKPGQMIHIEKAFSHIGKKYLGHVSELITQIKELKDNLEKNDIIHKSEILKIESNNNEKIYKYDMEKKDLIHVNEMLVSKHQNEIQKYENELLKKEIEILKLKNK